MNPKKWVRNIWVDMKEPRALNYQIPLNPLLVESRPLLLPQTPSTQPFNNCGWAALSQDPLPPPLIALTLTRVPSKCSPESDTIVRIHWSLDSNGGLWSIRLNSAGNAVQTWVSLLICRFLGLTPRFWRIRSGLGPDNLTSFQAMPVLNVHLG